LDFSVLGLPDPFTKKLDLSQVKNYEDQSNFDEKYVEAIQTLQKSILSKPGKKGGVILEIMDSMKEEFRKRVVDKLNSIALDLSKQMREEFFTRLRKMIPCDPVQLQECYNGNAGRICEAMKEKLKNVGDPDSVATIVGKALLFEYGHEKNMNEKLFPITQKQENLGAASMSLKELVTTLRNELDQENSKKIYIVGAKHFAVDVWMFPGVTIDCTDDLASLVDGNIKCCIAYSIYRNWGKNESWKDMIKWFAFPKKLHIDYTIGKSERQFVEFESGKDIILPKH